MPHLDEHDTLPPEMDPAVGGGTVTPPTDLFGILKRLGPGLIIAGSIVGSGELIATTKTGAQAGISLLWLVVIGCVIKVFVQIELGRYTISHGETTLAALDRVPGPRHRVNWIVWFWLLMVLIGFGQLGGIVGGVGQAMVLSFPLRGDYADAIRMPSTGELKQYLKWDDTLLSEWDVRLLLKRDEAGAAGTLSDAERRRVEAIASSTGERLSGLGPLGDRIAQSTRNVVLLEDRLRQSRSDGSTDAGPFDELIAARRSLRNLLLQANEDLTADDSSIMARDLRQRSPSQQERVLRGHSVLATQLAELDDDAFRSTKAIVAVSQMMDAESERAAAQSDNSDAARQQAAEDKLQDRQQKVDALVEPTTYDDKYWAAFIAVFTAALLFRGRYGLVQNVSMVLVVSFTFITLGNVMALQNTEQFSVSAAEIWRGLSFGIPEAIDGKNPVITALATFGIIGVGASELIAYPYWCLEKGYAKFAGPRSDDPDWAARARGWMKVMHYDAFLSMVVYTVATLAFFLMGVAVLYNEGRDPDGMRMVSTLATAYVPVFGEYARWLFLIGSIAVLYSTFMVANAGNARMLTDALKVFGLMDRNNPKAHDRSLTILCVALPLACMVVFCSGINPVYAILVSGTMQALLLPMIGVGALYFRYQLTDSRLKPSRLWDVLLCLSCIGLLLAGAYGVYSRLA